MHTWHPSVYKFWAYMILMILFPVIFLVRIWETLTKIRESDIIDNMM